MEASARAIHVDRQGAGRDRECLPVTTSTRISPTGPSSSFTGSAAPSAAPYGRRPTRQLRRQLDYILGHVSAVLSVTDGDGLVTRCVRRVTSPGSAARCGSARATCHCPPTVGPPRPRSRTGGRLAPPWPDYMSGTTSRLKGVRVTHANLRVRRRVGGGRGRAGARRPFPVVVLPLFHANAQYYSVMQTRSSRAPPSCSPRVSAPAAGLTPRSATERRSPACSQRRSG